MRRILVLVLMYGLLGCSSPSGTTFSGNNTDTKAATPVGDSIDVQPATVAQCPNGGNVLAVYQDANANGKMDDGEELNSQVVCNGANGSNGTNGANGTNGTNGTNGSDGANGSNGADGLNGLFALERVNTGLVACAAGSGLQVSYGLDANRSGVLDASEILQTQVVCDGSSGASGANGHSLVFQVLSADVSACAAGGSVILMAVDTADTGVFSANLPNPQSITLCNGISAATPAYTAVEPILACGNNVAYKEVLLRLANGQVLGSFSQDTSGTMTRLSFLPDGSYMNTDSSGCTFSLATSGQTRSISWLGQVQESWTMP